MAILKSTVVQGSLRVTDTTYTTDLVISGSKTARYALIAPTSDGAPTWRALTNADVGLGNVENTKLSTWAGTSNITTLGTVTTGTWSASTIAVNKGGTGATSFTSGALLIGNGTNAVSTRTIKNMTALGDLGWTAAATDIYIPTVNTLAYWNGRYNSSSSNLTYCNKGAFGNAVTYGVDDATANGALGTGTGLTTERSVYYGLVTVNGASQTRATGIYAPTSAGTANQILVSSGSGAPTWKATSNGAAYATSTNDELTFGTLPTAQGGTGNTTGTATYATTTQETAAELNPIGVTSTATTTLKRDTLITMTGGAISATSLGLSGALGVTGAATFSSTLSVSGKTTLNGSIVGKNNFNYGTALPSGNTEGRIYFQISSNEYELPTGGTAGQALIKASGDDRDVKWGSVGGIMRPDNGNRYYVTGSHTVQENTNAAIFDTRIYVDGGVLYGAAWNDYAEYREADTIEPGRVVIERGDDTLYRSTERLISGAEIISDTYGFAIGETPRAKTPIATSGRVLAYPYEDREVFRHNIGKPVCSGPNGTVSIMTQEEYEKYGYCAIGTISAVPDYEEWGEKKAKVNGRVWIRVK